MTHTRIIGLVGLGRRYGAPTARHSGWLWSVRQQAAPQVHRSSVASSSAGSERRARSRCFGASEVPANRPASRFLLRVWQHKGRASEGRHGWVLKPGPKQGKSASFISHASPAVPGTIGQGCNAPRRLASVGDAFARDAAISYGSTVTVLEIATSFVSIQAQVIRCLTPQVTTCRISPDQSRPTTLGAVLSTLSLFQRKLSRSKDTPGRRSILRYAVAVLVRHEPFPRG